MTQPVLYILARSDMQSMNPGKLAAQCCHAGNQFESFVKVSGNKGIKKLYDAWKKQGDGFGTTIVLDIGTESELLDFLQSGNMFGGPILDETYPLLDGETLHTFPCITCGWVFLDRSSQDSVETLIKLSNYSLYN